MAASLPSDYAVVSRYAAAHSNDVEQNADSADHPSDYHIARRPSHPSMAVSPVPQRPHLAIKPTENTPLLNAEPQVPRIIERHPEDGELSTAAIYLSELRILTKYS